MDELLHWTKHQDVLQTVVAATRLGIISDFDGTLSEFANSAAEAVIVDDNARALDRLAKRAAVVALVSGRGVADLHRRFDRDWLRYYGNHGLDRWHEDKVRIVPAAQEWRVPLERLLTEFTPPSPGVVVEDKGATASVHYRRVPDPITMRTRLREQLQPLCARYGFVLSEGRYIWEIKPPLSLSKGTAVQALIEDHQLNGAIFLGDDVTDLSAMAYLRSLRDNQHVKALSVGVIHAEGVPSGLRETCDITANGPHDVADLLLWIADKLNAP
jgi:trehalose 6-phosphate phosphatase